MKSDFISTEGFCAIGPAYLNKEDIVEKIEILHPGEILALADKELVQWPTATIAIRKTLQGKVETLPCQVQLSYLLILFKVFEESVWDNKLGSVSGGTWSRFMKHFGFQIGSIRLGERAVDVFVRWSKKYNKDLCFPS